MSEKLLFHFDGSLADDHKLNFYEAARFQYATARLLVKLEQFRNTGAFVKKITNSSNRDIVIEAPERGSFDLTVILPIALAARDAFISTSISGLFSYVYERISGKSSDGDVVNALNSQTEIVKQIGHIQEGNSENISRALDIIAADQKIKENLYRENQEHLLARLSEMERISEISDNKASLARIDPVREQKLISMAAPLISEMATVLRRSADTLEISSIKDGDRKNIVYLNRRMAQEIELSSVDDQITLIAGDIVQYNKETGWGKIRLDGIQLVSFNLPADIKDEMQTRILSSMGRSQAQLQSYIVRDKAGQMTRLIVVGIIASASLG